MDSPGVTGKRSKGSGGPHTSSKLSGAPPQKLRRWRFLSLLFLAVACAALLSAAPGLRQSARGTRASLLLPVLFWPLRFEALEFGDVSCALLAPPL